MDMNDDLKEMIESGDNIIFGVILVVGLVLLALVIIGIAIFFAFHYGVVKI